MEPRLWTPPLRELTPETSYGYDVIEFARDVLRRPLDPWQEWLVIHAGELLEDGRPRFRKVLVLVSRQNGKTEVCVVLTLYWMFIEEQPLIVGTSTMIEYAKEPWQKAVELAEGNEVLAEMLPPDHVRKTNGEVTLTAKPGDYRCRYKVAAANRRGGRSLTINRLVMDELREHADFSAYDAAVPAQNAVPDAQAFMISNQGDLDAVVLDSLRDDALEFIRTGEGDPRLGLFEWSAPPGAKPTDVAALAQSNPNLNIRLSLDSLMGDAIRAERKGGKLLQGFLTESMCMAVDRLDPAVNLSRWNGCAAAGSRFPDVSRRSRFACFDISEDMEHATLAVAAPLPDGRVYVRIRKVWTSSDEARAELLAELRALDVWAVAWYPTGPAAAFASLLRPTRKPRRGDPVIMPGRIRSIELTGGKVAEACQGLADLTKGQLIRHPADPLLDAHLKNAKKQPAADGWRFVRRDGGHVDAAFAAAGAVRLASARTAVMEEVPDDQETP